MGGFLDGTWMQQPGGRYLNRYDAGRAIANKISGFIHRLDGVGVVLGLPRGGVEVAAAVANDLKLRLDFRSVKKVGHPFQPEFAIGAVDISGTSVRNPFVSPPDMPSDDEFDRMVKKALDQAQILERELRGNSESYVSGADWCLVVDDGAATGLTILAVVRGLKSEGKMVHVAVPVSSEQARDLLTEASDSFRALQVPKMFMAVSQFYEDFSQVSMDAVRSYLK